MKSVNKDETSTTGTIRAVEQNCIIATTVAVIIEPAGDCLVQRGASSDACQAYAAPSAAKAESSNELAKRFKSLHIAYRQEAAPESPSPSASSSSDSDWYSSDNYEGQTKAYAPFSKFGEYLFDLASADSTLMDRRYFIAPGADGKPCFFCWGTDPRSRSITYLYKVNFNETILFQHHRTFNHSDSGHGPCPRELGYHFFQPTRTIYQQSASDNELGYIPVTVYSDEQAVDTILWMLQNATNHASEHLASPTQCVNDESEGQHIGYGRPQELLRAPTSLGNTSLHSSPFSLDSDYSLVGSGTPWSSPDAPANGSPDHDMPSGSKNFGLFNHFPNTSEPPLFPDASSAGSYNPTYTYLQMMSMVKGATSTPGDSGSTTGRRVSPPESSTGDLGGPRDEFQEIRISGLKTEDDVNQYVEEIVENVKRRGVTEVYCWDCKNGERRRSQKDCKQKCLKFSSLKRHVMGHLKLNNFPCRMQGCGFTTPHKDNLTRHEKEYHSGKRRHAKDQASKENSSNYRRPVRGETIRPSH